jgi:cold shock CspA family protein
VTGGGRVLGGSVVDFDQAAGLGTVATADGWLWRFHCTQIADGTRTIEVGTPVSFRIGPGHLGVWEAEQVSPQR